MSGPSTDEYRERLWIAFRRAGGLPKLSRTLEGRNAIVETCALEAQAAFLVLAAERDVLRKALEPTANAARAVDASMADDYEITCIFTAGALRAARSLLSEGGGE